MAGFFQPILMRNAIAQMGNVAAYFRRYHTIHNPYYQ